VPGDYTPGPPRAGKLKALGYRRGACTVNSIIYIVGLVVVVVAVLSFFGLR
jgi:hypothetical protein